MRNRCAALVLLLLLAVTFSGCRLFVRLPEEIADPRIREVHGLGAIPEDETWWQTRDRRRQEQDKLLFNFPLNQLWKQKFHSGSALVGAPVVDGRQVYLTRAAEGLVKLNGEDGIPVWTLAPESGEECGPLVSVSGLLVYATTAGRIIAVEPDLPRQAWESSTGGALTGPPAAGTGNIYFPTGDGELLALSAADGSMVWRQQTGEVLDAAPLVDEPGGLIYCGSMGGTMFCLDAASGVIRWRYDAGSPLYATPLLSSGLLCFGSDDGRFHCLRAADGAPRWVKPTGASIRTPAAAFENWVLFGSWDGYLYSLDRKSGRTRWKAELPNRMALAPVCIDELVLAACLRSPELTALQVEDGRSAGSFKLEHLDAWFTTPPLISGDYILYAGTSRGKLLALAEVEVEEMSEEEASRARFEELLGSRGEVSGPEGAAPGRPPADRR